MSYSNNLEQMYRQIIMDHYKNPRRKGLIEDSTQKVIHLKNPSCGDDIRVQTKIEGDKIVDIHHDGEGCSICCSSASMMCSLVKDKTTEEAKTIRENFENMLYKREYDEEILEDANALIGVSNLPPRIKCASISWDALDKAMSE